MQIRDNIAEYMQSLRSWLTETAAVPLEEMDAFFAARVGRYDDHMSQWAEAYAVFADFLPAHCGCILDLGCGTGLELASVFRRFPNARVIGVDMTESMLKSLQEKFPEKKVECICGDYFRLPLGENRFDAVISFESLHHFSPVQKQALFQKIFAALNPGGVFLECDYIACCQEEETLLRDVCVARRAAAGIPESVFVHFDTPLTAEHETALLTAAGFSTAMPLQSVNGATFLKAAKP